MSELKDKIVNHAKTEYNSSPYEFNDEQIQLIIEHNCECDHCGKSIFELDDFPDASVEHKEVLCEDCYDEEYRTTCPICEESWEIDDFTDYFFISKTNKERNIMAKIKQYELTAKQIQACKEIEKAFKTARKAGLSFYGKGGAISAYKTSAMKHAAPSAQYEGSGHSKKDWESPIPSYDLHNCIVDSGADDAEYFEKGFID